MGDLRRYGDVMFQALERAKHLGERGDLHVRAAGALVGRVESAAGIFAAQPVKNPHFGSDDELIRVADRRTLDHPFGRKDLNALGFHVAGRHGLEHARRAAALRVHEKFRVRVQRALLADVFRRYAGVHMTLAHPHEHVLPASHPAHVRAEEHVGQEENLAIGGDRIHDFHRVSRRTAVVAFRLHVSTRVDVRNDNGPGMLGLPLAKLLGGDRSGE